MRSLVGFYANFTVIAANSQIPDYLMMGIS